MDLNNVPNKELRKFGVAFFVFLSLLSTVIIWRHEWQISKVTGTMLGIAALFLIMGLFLPRQLHPIFKVWMLFARALGWLNSKILLTLIYYLMFAPISLGIRLFGGDMLNQKIRDHEKDFWITREEKDLTIERYQKQF